MFKTQMIPAEERLNKKCNCCGTDKSVKYKNFETEKYYCNTCLAETILKLSENEMGILDNLDIYMEDTRLLEKIILNSFNNLGLLSGEIESITATRINNEVKIAYDYDDYPYAYGSESVIVSIDDFVKLILLYKEDVK